MLSIALLATACGDGGGGDGNSAPVIDGRPVSMALIDYPYEFTPSTTDQDGDSLSFKAINLPRWAEFDARTGRMYGTPSEGDAGRYQGIDIEVSDGETASTLGAFTVDVVSHGPGTIAISWIPATQRENGSALTDLRGHRIYWGRKPGEYVKSVTIDNAGITAHVIDGLVPGAYHVAATTIDSRGDESDFSNPVEVLVN